MAPDRVQDRQDIHQDLVHESPPQAHNRPLRIRHRPRGHSYLVSYLPLSLLWVVIMVRRSRPHRGRPIADHIEKPHHVGEDLTYRIQGSRALEDRCDQC